MHMYVKYGMVILCLQYITCSYGQFLLKSFHELSSLDQLESDICSFYTPTQNILSSIQCAINCADINCCSSYGYDKSSKLCLLCLYQHQNPDLSSLTASTGVIPAMTRFYEKEKNDIPALNNCAEIYQYGEISSRVYNLKVSGQSFDVFCDMHTFGGGWTVFQRRQDGSVSFARDWTGYKQGFGKLTGEHWLGNDVLALMTTTGSYKLRVDLESFDGETRFAEYENFRVDDESENYTLTLGSYSGTAGEDGSGLIYFNQMQFSTIDRDNDISPDDCVVEGGNGGFWYNYCDPTNLNGVYRNQAITDHLGINWFPWLKYITLKRVEMKFRPIDFIN